MMLLKLTEQDGVTTRLLLNVDSIAFNMAKFFKETISLGVQFKHTETVVSIVGEEKKRADMYVKEWREHGRALTVVK